MRTRYSFSLLAASLVFVIVTNQAKLFAQYTTSTLATSTGTATISGYSVALDTAGNVYTTGAWVTMQAWAFLTS